METVPVPSIAVLMSGRGSNLRALIEAIEARQLRARIVVVISNKTGAPGLEHAERAGIATLIVPHREYPNRTAYDLALVGHLRVHEIELVCLAGFMRMLGPEFCSAFPNRVLNIHPSLLPAFPGVNAQQQALAHGVKVTGATVHFVTPELDAGPIISQSVVPVLDDDTEESLSARILRVEHEIYPKAIQRVLAGGWRIEGRRVTFPGPAVGHSAADPEVSSFS